MDISIETYSDSVPKYHDGLCDDQIRIVRDESGVAAILADGRNGGARASLLTSFAAKMMVAMRGSGASIDRVADMIAESQPSGGKKGKAGNIAFTLILALFDGTIRVEQFETPDVILLRRGRPVELQTTQRVVQGRTIRSGRITAKKADMIVAVGNGMLTAGKNRKLKDGWNLKNIETYMANAYDSRMSAEDPVRLLLAAGSSLSSGKPASDLSALAFRISCLRAT
ncbi:MAG: hypothetical protein ACQGTM_05725 [bacterium]